MNRRTAAGPITESAWEWFQRSQKTKAAPPADSAAAAWVFCRGATGIAFIDLALQRSQQQQQQHLPVLDIRGAKGKTMTLLSIVARYVVATRASQYHRATIDPADEDDDTNHDSMQDTTAASAPQAYLLDSSFDIVIPRLVHVVRSTLLRKITGVCDEGQVQRDLEDCLRRIQLMQTSDGLAGWVPLLETLRHRITALDHYPTLVVWDGFLAEPESDDASIRMEGQSGCMLVHLL